MSEHLSKARRWTTTASRASLRRMVADVAVAPLSDLSRDEQELRVRLLATTCVTLLDELDERDKEPRLRLVKGGGE